MYEDIQSMVVVQKMIDQKLNETCNIRSLVIKNLIEELERKKKITATLENEASKSKSIIGK